MKVREMIAALSTMPPEAEMGVIWDGGCRSGAEYVWLAKGGMVLIADGNDVVYDDDDRPLSAPTPEQERYWQMVPE